MPRRPTRAPWRGGHARAASPLHCHASSSPLMLVKPEQHPSASPLLSRPFSALGSREQAPQPWPPRAEPFGTPRLHASQPSQAVTGPGNSPYALYTLDRSRGRCLHLAVAHRAPPLPWPSSRAHGHDVVLSDLSVTSQTEHTTTSASPCCTHHTYPRPPLATVSPGHQRHVRRRGGSAWPGGHGPPLAEPRLLEDAPGPVDAHCHYSSIVIDHRAGNQPFSTSSAPPPS
jgi:hypothetical protein